MEEKNTGSALASVARNDTGGGLVTCAPAPPSHAGETAGGANGRAIGGALGQAIGVGVDVAVAEAADGGEDDASDSVVEPFNAAAEREFWRKEYWNRPYFTHGTPYEQYAPAFQYGWEGYATHRGKSFNEIEPQLALDWENHRRHSKLSWNHAKIATQDAWARAARADCPDACDSV